MIILTELSQSQKEKDKTFFFICSSHILYTYKNNIHMYEK